MDADKERTLIEIGYVIDSCGVCLFADIAAGQDWGTCLAHTYQHAKHTDTVRDLSIHRAGRCGDFEAGPDILALGAFASFLP